MSFESVQDNWSIIKLADGTHAREDRRLKVLVQASFGASKQRYGSPRIHEDLLEQQEHVSRKRVIRLMQEEGLQARARKRYHVTTMSDHDQPVAGNLLDRQFAAAAPNQRWVAVSTTYNADLTAVFSVTLRSSIKYEGCDRQDYQIPATLTKVGPG